LNVETTLAPTDLIAANTEVTSGGFDPWFPPPEPTIAQHKASIGTWSPAVFVDWKVGGGRATRRPHRQAGLTNLHSLPQSTTSTKRQPVFQ